MLIVDRFEGNYIILEDSELETNIKIEKRLVKDKCLEGDVLSYNSTEDNYYKNKEETIKRKNKLKKLFK